MKRNNILTNEIIGADLRAPSPSDVDAERGLGDLVDGISAFSPPGPSFAVVLDVSGGGFDRLSRGGSDSVPHRALRGGAELSGSGNPLEHEHDADVSKFECC